MYLINIVKGLTFTCVKFYDHIYLINIVLGLASTCIKFCNCIGGCLKALMLITFSSPRAQPEVVYFLISSESPYFSDCKSKISASNSL